MNITEADIRKLAPGAVDWIVSGIVEHQHLIPEYGVNTPRRLQHFMAQLAHESAGFKTTREYASGAAYEGRRDLGNVRRGDGRKFRGRGLIQLTGRANASEASVDLGRPYERDPLLLEKFPDALLAALWFWRERRINRLADRDDVVGVTRKINGGTNGLKDRKRYLARAKRIWPSDEKETEMPRVPGEYNPADPPIRYDKQWATRKNLKRLQRALYSKGYTEVGLDDGGYGIKTRNALRAFFVEHKVHPKEQVISDALLVKIQNSRPRRVSGSRSKITARDLEKRGSKTIATGNLGKVVGGGVATGGILGMIADWIDRASGAVDRVTSSGNSVLDFFTNMSPTVWIFLILAAGGVLVWFLFNKVNWLRVLQERTGKTTTNDSSISVITDDDDDDDDAPAIEDEDEEVDMEEEETIAA